MTLEDIKQLIQMVNDAGIAELEVTRGDNRVRIRRSLAAAPTQEIVLPATSVMPSAPAPAVAAGAPPALTAGTATVAAAAPAPVPDEKTLYVKSPIVGTYYECPSPGAPPFVAVGDRVSPGQVLCIIESMKLMNEIESDVSGIVMARLVENGRPVEYGESLFAIRPA
jgi:acetyl-CoA carboxylase biotin carboxyl carrier protein